MMIMTMIMIITMDNGLMMIMIMISSLTKAKHCEEQDKKRNLLDTASSALFEWEPRVEPLLLNLNLLSGLPEMPKFFRGTLLGIESSRLSTPITVI